MRLGIAGKLILTLGVCALLVLGLTGVMEYHASRISIEQEVAAKLDGISARLTLTLRRSTYEFDQETVHDTLLAEFPEPGLEAAAVWTHERQRLLAGLARDQNGQVIDVKTLPQGKGLIERVVPLYLSASNTPAGKDMVGEFALVFDQRYMEQRLLREILFRQAKSALMVLFLLLLLGEVVRRALVRPLEDLAEAMSAAERDAFRISSPSAVAGDGLSVISDAGPVFHEMKTMAAAFTSLLRTVNYRQQALAVSEQRYKELVEDTDALVVKLDADLVCIYINSAAEQFLGLSAAECIGRDALEFIHTEDRGATRDVLGGWVAGQKQNVSFENRLVAVTGKVTHVSWTASIAYDYAGDPIYYRAIGRDVTAQFIAEQKIRASEEYFRTVIQTSPDSIVLVDMQSGVILDANDVCLSTFGYTREDGLGSKTALDLDAWVDPSMREEFFRQIALHGQLDNLEASFRCRDGRVFPGLLSARRIIHEGRPCHLAFIKDISPLKETELALRQKQEKFRALSLEFEAVLEGIADSLILFNPQLEVVWANRGAAEQFGLTQEQIKGRICHQLWIGDDGGACADCVQAVFAGGTAFEGVRATPDGRTWGVKGYPIRDGDGAVVNVIQIASDLTEKMTLREEATRAAHLAALGSLSAGVAHEINNPTGLILMSVPVVQAVFGDILDYLDELPGDHEAMAFGGLPFALLREEIPQSLFDILGGAQRIRAIVEELKNFSRQEAQGAQERVDLGEVVNRALRLLGNLVRNSTRFFVLEIADDLPKVTGSVQRLEQVVVNLLQNACHALTSSGQAIEVKVTADRVRRLVVLQVRDEGVGIPAEIREKITDPFFTTRRESGGTGLGLSVSARIISEHGGALRIDSEPGHGSTFTVELPIQEEATNGD